LGWEMGIRTPFKDTLDNLSQDFYNEISLDIMPQNGRTISVKMQTGNSKPLYSNYQKTIMLKNK
jgi:hypothetical protein